MFKLRLDGDALAWLSCLPITEKDTFEHLSAAFLARFRPKEIEQHKFVKDLFSLKQQNGESVDSFITRLRKLALLAKVDEKIQISAALSGFLPFIASFALQHPVNTLNELMDLAHIAEYSRSSASNHAEGLVFKQLKKLSGDITRLSSQMVNMTTANVINRAVSRSPNRRQVSLVNTDSRSTADHPT